MTRRGQEVLATFNKRQKQILVELAECQTNQEIAASLGTSLQVVKNYMRDMMNKSGTQNRMHLVMWSLHHGVLKCPCMIRSEREHAKAS